MDYVPIRVSTLRGDQKIDFDAYVKINEKHILYLRKGDSFGGQRLNRLKEKKLRRMFILSEHEEFYRTYLHRNIEMAYDSRSGTSLENRTEIVQGAQQSHAEEIMENPEDAQAYSEAKNAATKFANFLAEEQEAFGLILGFENVDANIAHHGVTVSTIALSLAKRLNIEDMKQQQLLTLGSLLHDFGHFSSSLKINRPVSDFSPEELALYKKHPTEGGKKVQDKKHFDRAVINIIVQHEEYIDGHGFPNELVESKIDPLALIVGTANALDRLISFEGVPKKDAVKTMMIKSIGRYPLNYIQLLGEIMNSIKV